MAVTSKSAIPARRQQVSSRAGAVAASNPKNSTSSLKPKGSTSSPKPNGKTVSLLPKSQAAPLWLLGLGVWQRRFSVVTFLLVITTLTVYARTVYFQQTWSQAYRKLVTLQRDERQLTLQSEVLKNQMGLQAEQPATGLVPPNPAETIFLKPTPPQYPTSAVPTTKPSTQTQQLTPTPLGY